MWLWIIRGFRSRGTGEMLQSERGEGVEWIALKFKKKI